jgi:hypothetical protein
MIERVSGGFRLVGCHIAGLAVAGLLFASPILFAAESYVSVVRHPGAFTLSAEGKSAPIWVSAHDYPGVTRIARLLQQDIRRVSDAEPALLSDGSALTKEMVLVGTLGKSPVIDRLVREKKINAEKVSGRWETFLIQTVDRPMKGVDHALVIAGSDKRGTMYGMLDLSLHIGVSPWYWWADVVPEKRKEIYILPGRYTNGEPKVKYRGIFINDEAPALTGWAFEKFGGFNAVFYEHVFELILRLRGNFLWPAMWGRAFYDDDPVNPKLADEYGIVIGTSHHEPMMRAHDEWRRYGSGPWNYEKNADTLREYWRKGITRMGSNESIVTLGMRGDGDEPMSAGANIALLEKIVRDQRQILQEATGKDPSSLPQVWALYKEVQEYYDKGMRVPDDVTLLLCDDNWGNIRKLPPLDAKPRAGGYGIYYHFDYVGGPRNYKWLNTNQISRVWEQMRLAYEYGARQLWIVNVGDIKPMELPIQFFLDYAWNPDAWPVERLPLYTEEWASQQFGTKFAKAIARTLTTYTTYNSRRKPELLSPDTFSMLNYREAERVFNDYSTAEVLARRTYQGLDSTKKDAFYELVLHPVTACENLNELYYGIALNRLYASQGRRSTNTLPEKIGRLFKKDSALASYYNTGLLGGKWNHMMDQTHISYTSWQQPDKDVMPSTITIPLKPVAEMGVAIEGSEKWWPLEASEAVLPEFDPYTVQRHYFDVFNRGSNPLRYSIHPAQKFVRVNGSSGQADFEERLWVDVDWSTAPSGTSKVPIVITGSDSSHAIIYAVVNKPTEPRKETVDGFVESRGYVSMESEHYTSMVNSANVSWQRIPDLGRTLSGMTVVPVTAPSVKPGGNAPHLEYKIHFFASGNVTVNAYLSPTLSFRTEPGRNQQGLCYAISFDDQDPQIVNMHARDTIPDWKYPQEWNQAVSNNIKIVSTQLNLEKPGEHVFKFWMVDPGVVLQKLVIDTGGLKPSYLGPPESYYRKADR